MVAVWLPETGENPQSPYLHHAEDKLDMLCSLVAPASFIWRLLKQYPQNHSSLDIHCHLLLSRSS